MPQALIRPIILSAFLLLLACAANQSHADNLNIWSDNMLIMTDVSGPGQDSSSLTDGVRHYNALDVRSRGKLKTYDYSLDFGLKATNDDRRDIKNLSLTNLRGRISNQINTLNVGDTYESFSKYALNTAIKGAAYRYSNAQNKVPEITLLGGVAYSRWDNFWSTDATKRKLYGARLKQDLTQDLWLAASVVAIKDNNDRNFGSPLYDGNTLTFDLEYQPLPGLTIVGESSFSDIDEDQLNNPDVRHSGQAYRLEVIGDEDPSRVVLEYERVSPDFLTIAGSATSDREKFKASWRYKYSKKLTIDSAFLWYHDNLDGQLAVRTKNYKPEIHATLQQLGGRRYAIATLGYKFDRSYSSAVSTHNHFIFSSYRDRFGIFDSNTNLGVTFYETKDTRKNDEILANTSLSTRISGENVIWKPAIYLGTWRSDDELTDQADYIYEYSASLGCDLPKQKITSDLKVGQHKLLKDSADDAERLYASLNIYYRPELFSNLKNCTLYLRGLVNDYEYSTSRRDFRENRAIAGFTIRL